MAAIAGVKKRTLKGRMDELCALPLQGEAARLQAQVAELRPLVDQAIAIVDAHHGDSRFFDQMAYSVVRMETLLFVGLLLLEETLADPGRLALAREFLREALPEFQKHWLTVQGERLPDPAVLEL